MAAVEREVSSAVIPREISTRAQCELREALGGVSLARGVASRAGGKDGGGATQ